MTCALLLAALVLVYETSAGDGFSGCNVGGFPALDVYWPDACIDFDYLSDAAKGYNDGGFSLHPFRSVQLAIYFGTVGGRRDDGTLLFFRSVRLEAPAPLLLCALLSYPALAVGLVVYRMGIRAGRRLAHGCDACGYDLTGNTSGTCPECGRPVGNDRP